jgi:hypothetical protein
MPVEEEICIIYSSSGAGYTTVGQTLDDYNNLLEMLGEGINAQLQDNRKPLFLVERGGE